MSKIYQIPITWEAIRTYNVEAESLQQAVEKALDQFLREPDDEYLCDSFRIDEIIEENYPDEEYNEKEVINKVCDSLYK